MTRTFSLRARLVAIILTPLLVVAMIVGFWQLDNARRTATSVFDRSLLSAALAVSTDVAISGGDALSTRTRDILSNTSGGQVFYHVYAPDGVIVAGYATPPVGIPRATAEEAGPSYFAATYLGRDVHGVRLQNTTQIDGFSGVFTTTVWQDAEVRSVFVRDLVIRSLVTICGLIGSLAIIVWFGVRAGLRPLTDLENAIAQRSVTELSPIRRSVPVEVGGVVETLNRLFGQVSTSMTAQSEFVSNAAHQLRNPIAGVLSLAEAVHDAPSPEAAQERSEDLLDAARTVSDLSQKLLLLERAKAISPPSARKDFDLGFALTDWLTEFRERLPSTVKLEETGVTSLGEMNGDRAMLAEAIKNILDNALKHGGDGLKKILVSASRDADKIQIIIEDDGIGIPGSSMEAAKIRFQQLSPTSGSGLGVSIADAVARQHGGTLVLEKGNSGLKVRFVFPA